jgi:hypothetical protein
VIAAMEQDPREGRLSKIGILISVLFHLAVLTSLFLFAAREGMFGNNLRKIAVTFVPPQNVPEDAAVKQPDRPTESAAPQAAPRVEPVKQPEQNAFQPKAPERPISPGASPLPVEFPNVAPPSLGVPELEFGGGKLVETSSDPKALYRSYVEFTLRSNWSRPENVQDMNYVAEVQLAIDSEGQITQSEWRRGSGDVVWDKSVRQAVAQTRSIGRPPPTGFPPKILVRFDVQAQTEAPIP